jgi:hypothetical protein
MIYKLIELQNVYGYVLAPQSRISNGDDCITSNLFGIVSSRFGNKRCSMVLAQRLCCNKQEVLTIREHMSSLPFFGVICVVYMFILQWCFLFCFVCLFCVLYHMLPVFLDCSFLIVHSVHSNVYLAICVYNATFQQYFSNIFCAGSVVLAIVHEHHYHMKMFQ